MAMKNLKLIYNADAGNKSFKYQLDSVLKVLTSAGFDTSLLRVEKIIQVEEYLSQIKPDAYDTIIAAGGDGTLNIVVSCVLKYGLTARIGLIPAGTSNDFARSMGISKNFETAAQVIAAGQTTFVDIGKITTDTSLQYFINVFGAGTITNISHHVNPNLKNTIGNTAYYLKAVEKLMQDHAPLPVTITHSKGDLTAEIYFFLALNTGAAGGFDKLVERASINDGYFDMFAMTAGSIADNLALIMKFLKGEHLEDDRIIYYRDNYTKLTFDTPTETNIDGEAGPPPPVEISLLPSAIQLYIPKEEN